MPTIRNPFYGRCVCVSGCGVAVVRVRRCTTSNNVNISTGKIANKFTLQMDEQENGHRRPHTHTHTLVCTHFKTEKQQKKNDSLFVLFASP